VFFFNNVNARNYPSIYGIADAFYDLDTTGSQANLATTLIPGDTCIVATAMGNGHVKFTRFKLERVEMRADERGMTERVFCGSALQSETLSKIDAALDGLYSVFFDKNGNFKHQSVLQP